jgi:virulence factor Mce-like protein
MRRAQRIIRRLVPAVVLAAVVLVGGWLLLSGGDDPPTYTVELDNAFGLTEDSEFRAAGVRVGRVSALRVDRRTARALVDVELERTDFGDLRRDATCSVEPQSLIGEYFLDCDPGTKARLPEGATIPVEQTSGTIPPDLVASIMRRPQREQLSILISELGAGFAARGPELQQVIRRAIPALRETDRVLEILADNRRTLVALNRDASAVLSRLAANRRDVRRFVEEARDTATISARRRAELAETIRRLPAFLRELRPTLRELGTVAERQTPALRDLRASAGDLRTLLERLGPFAVAAEGPVDALGEASKLGTRAAGPAIETIRKAGALGRTAKDPATNLRFVLEHIDDRKNAVEKSPVSPGGQGFTGLEAFLRYPFVQSQALNLFDSRGYTLKLNALVNECTGYTNAETAKAEPERTRRCNAWLGPNQPGITTPDPSPAVRASSRAGRDRGRERSSRRSRPGRRAPAPSARAPEQPAAPQAPGLSPTPPATTPAPAPAPAPGPAPAPQTPQIDVDVQKLLEDILGGLGGRKPAPEDKPAPSSSDSGKAAEGLLDYLLGGG